MTAHRADAGGVPEVPPRAEPGAAAGRQLGGRLVVCAPLWPEARAVRPGIGEGGEVRVSGYGPGRARRQAGRLRQDTFGALGIAGTGGGLTDELRPGDLVVATEVTDGTTTTACPSAPLLAGELRRAGLAVAAGPVVGGGVIDGISWHWIFWLNVPIGVALIPLSLTFLTESFGPRPRLDFAGLALAGAGLLGLTWGLVRANTVGWGSVEVIASLAAGAVLLGCFLAWERRTAMPMLPLALFRNRGFSTANAVSFFMYAGLFGTLFLMAQFFQTALGNSPLEAGVRLLPWTATPMIVAPIAGGLADRFGSRPFMILGMTMQAVGLAWVGLIAKPDMGYVQLGIALTIAGIGTSLCFPTIANAVMGSVPPEEAGVASGTNSAVREVGGVFGVAVLAAVFTHAGFYSSPHAFVDRFQTALLVGAALTAAGIVAALLAPGRRPAAAEPVEALAVPQPALALAGDRE
jgi:MFS family permease